jgi:hypothetical protein
VHEEGNGMVRTTLAVEVAVVLVLVTVPIRAAERQDASRVDGSLTESPPRVRTDDALLSALIRQATDQSLTFRRLVESIQDMDAIVYVERGRCGHHVKACLPSWMAIAGPNRILQVVVEDGQTDIETMASIGHELKHVLEVLAERRVRTGAGIFDLYRRDGAARGVTSETRAAIDAGDAVYTELRRAARNHVRP